MAALVELRDVVKHFPVTRSLGEIVRGAHPAVHALDGVSFDLGTGDAVAIVGELGCGKTTLGRLLLKLAEPTAGSITFDGVALAGLDGERLRDFRRQAQLVFQNPFDALNPRFTVYRAVAEPLVNAGIARAEHADRVAAAFRRVHLADLDRYLDKYPHQLSGGQLQRVVLARALVLAPRFLVADEPVSMLDVSVRAGILALMREIRETMGLTAVYISHDLALVRYLCGRTLVMYLGCIVEDGADRGDRAPARGIPTARPWSRPFRCPTPTSPARRCRSAAASRMRASRPRAAGSATAARARWRAAPRRRRCCARLPAVTAWPATSTWPECSPPGRGSRPRRRRRQEAVDGGDPDLAGGLDRQAVALAQPSPALEIGQGLERDQYRLAFGFRQGRQFRPVHQLQPPDDRIAHALDANGQLFRFVLMAQQRAP